MQKNEKPVFVDDYFAALLAQASQLISAEFHKVVVGSGLSVPEWRMLATLAGGRSMSLGRLAQISVTKQPTVSRLLDRMEQRAYVERVADEEDRRITRVRITPQGQQVVSTLIEQARKHEKKVLSALDMEQAQQLKATLQRIIELHRPPA
ncbi:MarR family transcriptional regulator [soil metagenome]